MTLQEARTKGISFHALYLASDNSKIPYEEWDKYLTCKVDINQEDDFDEETGKNGGYIWGKIQDE